MELAKIALGLAGLAVAGYVLKDGSTNLPLPVGTMTAATATGEPSGTADLLRRELPGQILRSPGMALPGGQYALVTDAFRAFTPATRADLPAGLLPLDMMPDCAFRSPVAGERVASVAVDGSNADSAIDVLSEADLADAAMRMLTNQKKNVARTYDPADFVPPSSMGVVDVIVTDTSAPVYLILQSHGARVLWNLQVAAGVRIAHVSMIVRGTAGIAHLDPAIPIQVAAEATCGVRMAREPGDDWDFVRNTTAGRGDEDLLRQHVERHAAYSDWFESRFGQPSEAGLVGFLQADHVLIGPVPREGERLVQTSLAGAELRVTPLDHVVTGPEAERATALTGLLADLLDRAVGADFATLRAPKPVTRTE